jgi:pyruvate formate lyase activating enzyme
MIIKGVQKTSLVDFPGRVCLTVFTGGCNFLCPWCHNLSIVIPERAAKIPDIPLDEIKRMVIERGDFIDGVCITGGEPTLKTEGLIEFMLWVKSEGLQVKLDTNGYLPEVLKRCYKQEAVDFTSMDIKNSSDKYAATAGLPMMDLKRIEESVDLIKKYSPEYQFRTTLAPGLVTETDLEWIRNRFDIKLTVQPFRKPDKGLH